MKAAQWVKYNGSDEQIAEIKAAHDVAVKIETGRQFLRSSVYASDFYDYLKTGYVIEYLICAPHPLADMICQWARTGQPVYVRITEDGDKNEFPELSEFIESIKHVETYCTNTPDWNIPGAEYSFTPFVGEV